MNEQAKIERQLRGLTLAQMNGRLNYRDAKRQESLLLARLSALRDGAEPDMPELVIPATNATRSLTSEMLEQAISNIYKGINLGALRTWAVVDWTALTDYTTVSQPRPPNAADRVWTERGGIIVCECDDPECLSLITIGRDEYLEASGAEGHYRLTHPACSFGILRARLMVRGEHWFVWAKDW